MNLISIILICHLNLITFLCRFFIIQQLLYLKKQNIRNLNVLWSNILLLSLCLYYTLELIQITFIIFSKSKQGLLSLILIFSLSFILSLLMVFLKSKRLFFFSESSCFHKVLVPQSHWDGRHHQQHQIAWWLLSCVLQPPHWGVLAVASSFIHIGGHRWGLISKFKMQYKLGT